MKIRVFLFGEIIQFFLNGGYFFFKLKLKIKEKMGMLIIISFHNITFVLKILIIFIDRMIGVGYCTKKNDKEIGGSNIKTDYIYNMLMPGNSRFYSIFFLLCLIIID